MKFLPKLFPLGVVVRFRTFVAESITLRPYGTSQVCLLLGQKKLGTHVVVVVWVASNANARSIEGNVLTI